MVNENNTYHEVESEDGGVPLPSLGPEQMDLDYAESSSGSSTSMMSQLSLHSAQPSMNGSDTTSPTAPLFSDQHGFLGVFEGTNETLLSEASNSLPEHSSTVEENALLQHGGISGDNLVQESIPPNAQSATVLYAPDNGFVHFQSTESSAPDAFTPLPFSLAEDLGLESTMPAPYLVSNSQNAEASNSFQVYPPTNENHNCDDFMQLWKELWLNRKSEYPSINYEHADPEMCKRPKITIKTMAKTSCDIQGIRWSHYQTSKPLARHVRRMTSKNFGHMHDINPEQPREAYATPSYKACFKSDSSPALSVIDDFFRFRETNLMTRPRYSHGQLRHCLCASSTSAVFYFDLSPIYPYFGQQAVQIMCLSPVADSVHVAMDLSIRHDSEAPRLSKIACMSASDGLLIAGDLHEGYYAMKSLSRTCDDADIRGTVNEPGFRGAGINHIHTFLHRHSGLPRAVFCANDGYVRVMDCNTTRWVHDRTWESLVNCSATSPDGRLRIHVSDDQWPIVSEAETGEILARLPGHKDHGFACDWSPDGVNMATGHQDGIVQVWDARKMKEAVHVLPAEMGGIRSLKFSPLGAGHPVLVMAEPMDFVSIVDARTFRSKQDIEFFGEISGITMPPDGGSLFIGNADLKRGGIYEFERTGYNGDFKHRNFRCSNLRQRKTQKRQALYNTTPENSDCEDSVEEASTESKLKRKWKLDDHDVGIWLTREHDWASEANVDNDRRAILMKKQRWRRDLGLDEFVF